MLIFNNETRVIGLPVSDIVDPDIEESDLPIGFKIIEGLSKLSSIVIGAFGLIISSIIAQLILDCSCIVRTYEMLNSKRIYWFYRFRTHLRSFSNLSKEEESFFAAVRDTNASKRTFLKRIDQLSCASSTQFDSIAPCFRDDSLDEDLVSSLGNIIDSDSDDDAQTFRQRQDRRLRLKAETKRLALEQMKAIDLADAKPTDAPLKTPQKSTKFQLSLPEVFADRERAIQKRLIPDLSRGRQTIVDDLNDAAKKTALSKLANNQHISQYSLSQELISLEKSLLPSPEQLEEKDEFLRRLQNLITGTLKGGIVSPFGSVVNGFWTPDSDIDICLQVMGCGSKAGQIKVLQALASELHKVQDYSLQTRFSAAIPIIHWAAKKKNGISCDVSVNNILALVNSRLLGAYCQLDPRFKTLGFAIKTWAQKRDLNDRSRGTLSSFSLILMLIHYMQRRPIPILPSLQDLAIDRNQKPVYISGVDCKYSTDLKDIRIEMNNLTMGKVNQENISELLVGFFQYYGYTYRQGPISIRNITGLLGASSVAGDTYLFVDNPFEVGKDVANILPSNYAKLRSEFRRAADLLKEGRGFQEICTPLSLGSNVDHLERVVGDETLRKFIKG